MDNVVATGIAVPQKIGGFGITNPEERFGLEVFAVLAVEVVRYCYRGGVVEGEQLSTFGKDIGDEGGFGRGDGDCRGRYCDCRRRSDGMGPRYCESVRHGVKGIEIGRR